MGGIRTCCVPIDEPNKMSDFAFRGSLFGSIQDPPSERSQSVRSLQRDRRRGHTITLSFDRSERVSGIIISSRPSYGIYYSMDYMYNACSTTARRGALDWAPIFEKANLPIFEKLYESVKNGTETRKALEYNSRSTYRQDLAKELAEIDDQEIWRAGND